MAYLISNQHIRKGLNPKIYVIDSIYNIKDKSTLHIIVANHTNKHVTFTKGHCIGHMELPIDNMPQTSVNSVVTQKMIDKQVQPDTCKPPSHNLSLEVKQSLDKWLESLKSQFTKDETCIVMTNLTKMQIDTGNTEPVSQKT